MDQCVSIWREAEFSEKTGNRSVNVRWGAEGANVKQGEIAGLAETFGPATPAQRTCLIVTVHLTCSAARARRNKYVDTPGHFWIFAFFRILVLGSAKKPHDSS